MNEFIRKFVMDTIKEMIGNVAEWQVREYTLGWYSKGVLTQADLEEIQRLIEESKEHEPIIEETTEETEVEPTGEEEKQEEFVEIPEETVTENTETNSLNNGVI